MIGSNYINLETFYCDFNRLYESDKSLCRKFGMLK
jgi:hypothetical protein